MVKCRVGVAPQEGTIMKYDPETCTHMVRYDGDEEKSLDLLAPQRELRLLSNLI